MQVQNPTHRNEHMSALMIFNLPEVFPKIIVREMPTKEQPLVDRTAVPSQLLRYPYNVPLPNGCIFDMAIDSL
jgi:hypothetical protein